MEEFEISSSASSLNAHSASAGGGTGGSTITASAFGSQAPSALAGGQGLAGGSAGASGGLQQVGPNQGRNSDAGGSYCLSWCPNRCPAPMMVVGLGRENGARVSCKRKVIGKMLIAHARFLAG
jgi:hypothetical protein